MAEQQDTSQVVRVMNPIIGYVLLFCGIMVMIASLFQLYQVYTKKAQPIQFFNFEGIKIDPSSFAPKMDMSPLQELQRKSGLPVTSTTQTTPTEPVEIFPAKMLNDSANLSAFFFLMGFLLNFGFKIAQLGIKMVRPVYVKA